MHLGKGAKQENEKNETSYIRGKGGRGLAKEKKSNFVFFSASAKPLILSLLDDIFFAQQK